MMALLQNLHLGRGSLLRRVPPTKKYDLAEYSDNGKAIAHSPFISTWLNVFLKCVIIIIIIAAKGQKINFGAFPK